MKKRYTDEQIIRAIKEHEAGAKVDDLCRDLGISNNTFYNWRCKFASMEVNNNALIDRAVEIVRGDEGLKKEDRGH